MAAPAVAAVPAAQKLMSEIGRIVLARIAAGRLVLPVMPEVANRCINILKDSNFQQKKLVTELEREPLLATMVLRAALTAQNAGAGVKSLDQAISCLGAQRVKGLVAEYMARELFRSPNTKIQAANKKVWEHSVAVAHLARDLAAIMGGAHSDTCYLVGLLHDIGKPIVASMLLEAERQLGATGRGWVAVEEWVVAIESVHRQVGVAVATEWRLPDEVTSAIRDCNEYDASDRTGAANIVRFANALAKREGFITSPIDAEDVDALVLVGRSMLGTNDDVVARLVAGLPERVAQAVS